MLTCGFVGIQFNDQEARDRHDCEPGSVDLYVGPSGMSMGHSRVVFSAHVPIVGVDIWEHVRVDCCACYHSVCLSICFTGVLPPGEFNGCACGAGLIVVFFFVKYYNVKADVSNFCCRQVLD